MTAPATPLDFVALAVLGGLTSQPGGRETGGLGVLPFYINGLRGQGGQGGHLQGYIYTRKGHGVSGLKKFLIENLQMSSLTSLTAKVTEKKREKGGFGENLSSLLGGLTSQHKSPKTRCSVSTGIEG